MANEKNIDLTGLGVFKDELDKKYQLKESGKGLSTNDYSDEEKQKVSTINNKADKSEMSVIPGTGNDSDKTTITLKSGTSITVLTQHQNISSDLATKANVSDVYNKGEVNGLIANVVGSAPETLNTLKKISDKLSDNDTIVNTLTNTVASKANASDIYTKTETYTKTEVNGLVDTPHQEYVTVDAFANLPATGSKDTIYRVSNYNGSTSQVDETVYSEYAWNGSSYTFLCVKSQIGEVFDISVYNNNAKYADLAAALNGGANIPQSLQKGGMSVKFVQSSDNKYVQYRLMADEFTTDTTQWAIADEDVYVENPEFVYVQTDKDDKILWAIKIDGGIYYGAGVPQQIKEYVEEKISSLSLDEYEDMVAFLSDYLGSDTTLKTLIDSKLDAEGLDHDALETVQAVENPEYIQVTTDSEDKILEGIISEGIKRINIPIDTPSATIEHTKNPEWINATTDIKGKIIHGIKEDGTTHINQLSFDTLAGEKANINILNLGKRGQKKLQEDLGLDYIKTGEKKQEFCSLFNDATGDVESFIFFSDPHWFTSYDKCEMKEGALDYLKTMKDMFDNTPTDFVLCGGDWLNNHRKSTAIKDLGWIDGFMNSLFPNKYYPVYGNHDDNIQGEQDDTQTDANDGELSRQQMINLWFRKWGKMYYSFKGTNTRFFVLDTAQDWVQTMDEYRWTQIDWLANELLSNEDEHIIIALHIVTNSGRVFGENVALFADNALKLADAFNNRNSITLNDVTYDFTSTSGTVHAAICGHTHYDGIATVNNIPVYCIDYAFMGNFDIILVDYGTKKLRSIRIGNTGFNREMNLI